jgi:hypothetical protein
MIMENELWTKVYQIVQGLGNSKRPKRATYSNADILLTYLWAVLHDRPVYWACQKSNWPIYYRRRNLPNPSTMTRRLRTNSIQQLIRDVEEELINRHPPKIYRWIDAKPLPVSRNSKDKDAAYGHAEYGFSKGYKLHAVADESQGFVAWFVRPMNHNEATVADGLILLLDDEGYLVGDGAYDKNRLYDMAGQKSIQFIAPQRIKNAKGIGHKRNSPYRIRALSLQKHYFGQELLQSRNNIETMFGQLTNLGCGLSPLPNWVRRQFRVEMWVRGKMIFYQLWRQRKTPNAA